MRSGLRRYPRSPHVRIQQPAARSGSHQTDSATNTAHIGSHALGDGFWQFTLERDVTDREASAGLEDAGNLSKDSRLIRGKVENAVGDDAIDRGIRQRDVVDGGLVELDIGVSTSLCI